MKTDVIGIRIDEQTSELLNTLIEYKIVKNKTDAVRWIMKHGMQTTKKIIEKKKASQFIIEKWKKEGFPELPENLSEISIKERE
jgi:gamma-glutamyl phosphate reductase